MVRYVRRDDGIEVAIVCIECRVLPDAVLRGLLEEYTLKLVPKKSRENDESLLRVFILVINPLHI